MDLRVSTYFMRGWGYILRHEMLGTFGAIASILGLGVSLWVLKSVAGLQTIYLFKARVPALLEEIDSSASNLSNLLNAFDKSREEVDVEIGRLSILVGSVKKKVKRRDIEFVPKAQSFIKEYNQNKNRQNAHNVYVAVRTLAVELKGLLEDSHWK